MSCGDLLDSLYLVVSNGMCVVTCLFGKGPIYGVKFWYQFMYGMVSIMIVFESCLVAILAKCMVAILAQCMVVWASVSLWEWA